MDKEKKHTSDLETTNYCPSLLERRRGRQGGEQKRSGGMADRRKKQGWEEHKALKQREIFEGWRMYIYILHT